MISMHVDFEVAHMCEVLLLLSHVPWNSRFCSCFDSALDTTQIRINRISIMVLEFLVNLLQCITKLNAKSNLYVAEPYNFIL